METISNRLSWSRVQAGYKTPQAAVDRFGWKFNTYKSHDNGVRPNPTQDDVRKYAKAFGVDFVWLLTGEGSAYSANFSRIAGRIGAGAEIQTDIEAAYPEGSAVGISLKLPPDGFAFEVSGESMWPRYAEGDLLVCGREIKDVDQAIDQEVALQTKDGRRYIKILRRTNRAAVYDLSSHNAETIKGVRVDWAAPVVFVLRKGQWGLLEPAAQKRLLSKPFGFPQARPKMRRAS